MGGYEVLLSFEDLTLRLVFSPLQEFRYSKGEPSDSKILLAEICLFILKNKKPVIQARSSRLILIRGYSHVLINILTTEFDLEMEICITRKYIIIYELYLLFIVYIFYYTTDLLFEYNKIKKIGNTLNKCTWF